MDKQLERQEPCSGQQMQNQFVRTHSRTFSGLIRPNDDHNANLLIFVRPSVVEMWNALDKMEGGQLHVLGSPGTGKTTVAWAWACFKAQQRNVLWANISKTKQTTTICHFSNKRMNHFQGSTKHFAYFTRKLDADFMVLDGVTSTNYKDLIGDAEEWGSKGTNRKIVVLTSQQISIPLHDFEAGAAATWSMPSWTWEEYQTACENEYFYQQVERFLPFLSPQATKQAKLTTKYNLAGNSVRLMFGTFFDDLPAEIEKQLQKVDNKENLLAGLNLLFRIALNVHAHVKHKHIY